MRILLTAIADERGRTPEVEPLADALSEAGHQVDLFVAPFEANKLAGFEYNELKKQLRHTVNMINPDVIECLSMDNIASALRDMGYAYILDLSDKSADFKLTAEEDTLQKQIIHNASFIFTQNENQRSELSKVLHIENKKIVTMPFSVDMDLIAQRLAYYQQMLVRHSLH